MKNIVLKDKCINYEANLNQSWPFSLLNIDDQQTFTFQFW